MPLHCSLSGSGAAVPLQPRAQGQEGAEVGSGTKVEEQVQPRRVEIDAGIGDAGKPRLGRGRENLVRGLHAEARREEVADAAAEQGVVVGLDGSVVERDGVVIVEADIADVRSELPVAGLAMAGADERRREERRGEDRENLAQACSPLSLSADRAAAGGAIVMPWMVGRGPPEARV